jgi:hypothetical protein
MIRDFRSSSLLNTRLVLLRIIRLWLLIRTTIAASNPKLYKICSATGGLDVARLVSSNTRSLFRSAIEDVEFIREYISEAAYNHGIVGGLSDLDAIAATLDWQARGKSPRDTTVTAGLAYCDDREDRRVDRFVSLSNNQPFHGDKAADMALIDTASNILPWIVDRRSVPSRWWTNHTNGRSTLDETTETDMTDSDNQFQQLYTAAWIVTKGEANLYYPPLRVYGHPLVLADVVGPHFETQDQPFVKPNLPENNPTRYLRLDIILEVI